VMEGVPQAMANAVTKVVVGTAAMMATK